MINADRIVPITVIDLLTMYGNIFTIAGETITALQATNPGFFEVSEASTDLLAAEPVANLDFATGVSTATVYFIPAYDYTGFTVNGAAVTPTGDVSADGRTLYKAVLSSGAITITKVGF